MHFYFVLEYGSLYFLGKIAEPNKSNPPGVKKAEEKEMGLVYPGGSLCCVEINPAPD